MTDLGVAHIVVGGQTDSLSVRTHGDHRVLLHEHIESGGISCIDRVSAARGGKSDTVHNYRKQRAAYAVKLI